MEYKIENIPVPNGVSPRGRMQTLERRTINQLEVGQSFAVPPERIRAASNALHAEHRMHDGRRFTLKAGRVYRIA